MVARSWCPAIKRSRAMTDFAPEVVRLSRYFTRREFEYSHTWRKRLDQNRMTRRQIVVARALLREADKARAHFGRAAKCNSGYRCPALNRAVGGWKWSQHMIHDDSAAIDIEIPGVSNMALALWISQNCEFDELLLEHHHNGERNSGWVHLSFSLSKNRGTVESIVRTLSGPRRIDGLQYTQR